MSSVMKGIIDEGEQVIVLYIDGKPAVKFVSRHEAKEALDFISKRHPDKKFELKQEVRGGIDGNIKLDENLHQWFKEKWVRFGPDGKIRGACARGDDSEGKPKCLPQKKAQNLGKKGRKYAASKKRREDPNPERKGPAKNVATKKKTNEEKKPEFMKAGNMKPFTASGKEIPGSVSTLEKLLVKAKERGIKLNYANIDQMMQAVAKKHHLTGDELHNEFVAKHHMIPDNWIVKQLDEACWKGYHKEGKKKMFGKTYPNCVKNEGVAEGSEPDAYGRTGEEHECGACHGSGQEYGETCVTCGGKGWVKDEQGVAEEKCPHCGGELVSEEMMNEKQDACYSKVKSRYKVWPSAYASGALVQCRKKGASNWGNGKKTESSIMKGIVDEAGSPAQQAAIAIAMKKAGKKPKNEGTYTAPGDTKLPMDEAYRQARHITKQIKYDQTVSEILTSIQILAEKAGISEKELQDAENEVYAAESALESAVYGLDEVFKEALERQRYEQDDEEIDEDSDMRYAAEKTPTVNPYAGVADRQFRGAISETPTDNPTGASGEGGWRTYRPKPAGEIEEDTAYAGGMGQGGNAGQSYRKFKPKMAGVIRKESAIMKGLRNEGE